MEKDFTPEELQALKEVAKDRLAVSRIWGKTKTFSLSVGGVVAVWFTAGDHIWAWVKAHLGLN